MQLRFGASYVGVRLSLSLINDGKCTDTCPLGNSFSGNPDPLQGVEGKRHCRGRVGIKNKPVGLCISAHMLAREHTPPLTAMHMFFFQIFKFSRPNLDLSPRELALGSFERAGQKARLFIARVWTRTSAPHFCRQNCRKVPCRASYRMSPSPARGSVGFWAPA